MRYAGSLSGDSAAHIRKVSIQATVVAGQPVIEDANDVGSVTDPTGVTDLANVVGVTLADKTYSATQGASDNLVDVVINERGIFAARCNPSATSGTAYADGDGSFLTATANSAGGTTITDADVGTATKAGGTVFALTGANAGLSRVVTTFNSNTSIVVTHPFPNAIATGDTFLVVPYRVGGTVALQLTSDFTEANTAIAVGTGGAVTIYGIRVNTDSPASLSAPEAEVLFRFADHVYSENT